MKAITASLAFALVATPASAQVADASAAFHLPFFSGPKEYNAALDKVAPRDPSKTYIVPKYRLAPGAKQFADLYPPRAEEEHKDGLGVLECQWDASGVVRNCKAIAEAPVGYGFGEATRQAMDGHVQLDVSQVTVSPDNGLVRLSYRWTLR